MQLLRWPARILSLHQSFGFYECLLFSSLSPPLESFLRNQNAYRNARTYSTSNSWIDRKLRTWTATPLSFFVREWACSGYRDTMTSDRLTSTPLIQRPKAWPKNRMAAQSLVTSQAIRYSHNRHSWFLINRRLCTSWTLPTLRMIESCCWQVLKTYPYKTLQRSVSRKPMLNAGMAIPYKRFKDKNVMIESPVIEYKRFYRRE